MTKPIHLHQADNLRQIAMQVEAQYTFGDEMNGLDPSPEALVEYVRGCGIKEPRAWLDAKVPGWDTTPVPQANQFEVADDD